MKILKVEFENINSLKGFHEIDFSSEPFVTNSLFAITGPTGSGKSSILDVICLAIYGKIPRIPGSREISRNDIEKLGTILTRNQENAFARVVYESRFGTFIAQWDISTNSNGNLRNPSMEIKNAEDGSIITSKKSEAPGKNEELIGLSYDQFIKSVLLAQGEFAQFLKTKKEERGELLEKITGTGIYRQLGIKAFEKNREANREIQDQQSEIDLIKRDLLDEENLKNSSEELKRKNQLSEKLEKDIEGYKKLLKTKEDIITFEKEIKDQKSRKDSASKQLSEFNEHSGKILNEHETVQIKADELRNWKQHIDSLAIHKKSKKELKESIQTNQGNLSNTLNDAINLINQKTNPETLSEDLIQFRKKVISLQDKKSKKLALYSSKADLIKSELRDTTLTFDINDPDKLAESLSSDMEDLERNSDVILMKLKLEKNEDFSDHQKKMRSKLNTVSSASKEFIFIENLKGNIKGKQSELEESRKDLKPLPNKIEKSGHRVEGLKKDLKNLRLVKENAALKASLEEHRSRLEDDKPCPLCGSIHHPYVNKEKENEKIEENEISDLEEKLSKANKSWNELLAEEKALKNRIQKSEKELTNLQANFASKQSNFHKKYDDFKNLENQDDFDNLIENIESQIELLSELEKIQKLERSIQIATPLATELKEIKTDGLRLKAELDILYTGNDIQEDVQVLIDDWNRYKQNEIHLKKSFSENLKNIEDKSKLITETEKNLSGFLADSVFENLEDAWSSLLPEVKAQELQKEQQTILQIIDRCNTSIKLYENQLRKKKEEDIDLGMEELQGKIKNELEQFKVLKSECKELERKLKNNEEKLERMRVLKEVIAEKEKQTRRWRLLNELIGDSKGKMFNDFAQDLTLTHLLALANIRLKDLNDRYLIDKPQDEEDDGLIAIDEHMGGQRRSIKTLSGGETFILSLSMALALSDLASKNVDINSLFIDEGFGTLDPETLDQTLDTLEKLQQESSKTIGVISHVESLKERITTQIQLSRNGQGYSKLEIQPKNIEATLV